MTRYGLGVLLASQVGSGFPWTTLGINLSGSLLLGLLSSLATEREMIPAPWRAPLMVGFVGAYTTFSTWAVDTDLLLVRGGVLPATLNVLVSIAAGLPLARAGLLAGRRLPGHNREPGS